MAGPTLVNPGLRVVQSAIHNSGFLDVDVILDVRVEVVK
jgi:hypothetical protein